MKPEHVLITGASRGIGKAIACEFAAAGYNLTLCCKNKFNTLKKLAAELENSHGITAAAFCCDVSNSSDVKAMFSKIPPVDIIINNAGISYVGLITDMSDEDWAATLNTNLSSAFYVCRAAIPGMLKKKSGRIINISSVWGEAGASMEVAYSASKGGLNAFTKSLAKELAPSNISVNAVSCGLIDTEMNSHLTSEEIENVISEIPADRIGNPNEVAKLVLQIAKSGSYMTGQIIKIDGGWI